jgi:chaperonin cofactor prefoldin
VEILGKNQMEILEVKISVCQRKTERLQKDWIKLTIKYQGLKTRKIH